MTGNSKSIGIILSGLLPEFAIPLCVYYHKFYISYKYMMCHWVVHLKMKPIDADELFNRKFVIDELESNINDKNETESSVVA